ncbi:hypothetical protein VPH35_028570 [Triticum aestivum]
MRTPSSPASARTPSSPASARPPPPPPAPLHTTPLSPRATNPNAQIQIPPIAATHLPRLPHLAAGYDLGSPLPSPIRRDPISHRHPPSSCSGQPVPLPTSNQHPTTALPRPPSNPFSSGTASPRAPPPLLSTRRRRDPRCVPSQSRSTTERRWIRQAPRSPRRRWSLTRAARPSRRGCSPCSRRSSTTPFWLTSRGSPRWRTWTRSSTSSSAAP